MKFFCCVMVVVNILLASVFLHKIFLTNTETALRKPTNETIGQSLDVSEIATLPKYINHCSSSEVSLENNVMCNDLYGNVLQSLNQTVPNPEICLFKKELMNFHAPFYVKTYITDYKEFECFVCHIKSILESLENREDHGWNIECQDIKLTNATRDLIEECCADIIPEGHYNLSQIIPITSIDSNITEACDGYLSIDSKPMDEDKIIPEVIQI